MSTQPGNRQDPLYTSWAKTRQDEVRMKIIRTGVSCRFSTLAGCWCVHLFDNIEELMMSRRPLQANIDLYRRTSRIYHQHRPRRHPSPLWDFGQFHLRTDNIEESWNVPHTQKADTVNGRQPCIIFGDGLQTADPSSSSGLLCAQ